MIDQQPDPVDRATQWVREQLGVIAYGEISTHWVIRNHDVVRTRYVKDESVITE
jgi:hypothetical protein